ncbi:MAG: hypothetical protein AAFR69_11820 [Pseudomonadota bacterium]
MKTIKTYYGPEQAMTALSLLHAHGIEARLLDGATLSVLPLDSVALGGYRLAVPEAAAAQSLDLLIEHDAPGPAPEGRAYFGDEYDADWMAQRALNRQRARRILIALGLFVIAGVIANVVTGVTRRPEPSVAPDPPWVGG